MPQSPSPPEASPIDPDASDATPVPFEQALDELETIVSRMEDGKLSLDESLAAYRRGASLVKVCETALERAKEQVRVLDGELLRPLSEMTARGTERGMSAVLAPQGSSDVEAWMRAMRDRAEGALERILPPATEHPAKLHEAMRYATLGGGKRVRAMLVHAAGTWAIGRTSVEDASHDADAVLDAAASAVELIHAYSLVHDDMPCMDDDDLRRGRPTVHVAYDEATALLVGDALQTLAFEVLAAAPDRGRAAARVTLLARASGSAGMAGGQAIDLDSVGKPLTWPALETMHRAKTGALLRASVLLGATASAEPDAREREALDRYAAAIGLAFQVVDDILDVETDSATLGKTAGKDAEHDKPTVVTTLGMPAAKGLAARLRDDAYRSLDDLGGRVDRLADLAGFITGRSY